MTLLLSHAHSLLSYTHTGARERVSVPGRELRGEAPRPGPALNGDRCGLSRLSLSEAHRHVLKNLDDMCYIPTFGMYTLLLLTLPSPSLTCCLIIACVCVRVCAPSLNTHSHTRVSAMPPSLPPSLKSPSSSFALPSVAPSHSLQSPSLQSSVSLSLAHIHTFKHACTNAPT
jgi:hypothetical protein